MGIYCPTCGEPWEMDSLHEEVKFRYPGEPWVTEEKPEGVPDYKVWYRSPEQYHWKPIEERPSAGWHNQQEYENRYYNEIRLDFYGRGCKAMTWIGGNKDYCKPKAGGKALLASAAYDIMGDDLDGAAAMMEDYAYMFGEEE